MVRLSVLLAVLVDLQPQPAVFLVIYVVRERLRTKPVRLLVDLVLWVDRSPLSVRRLAHCAMLVDSVRPLELLHAVSVVLVSSRM